jgi:hypothetical protein
MNAFAQLEFILAEDYLCVFQETLLRVFWCEILG